VKATQQQNEQYSRNDGDAGGIRVSHGHWLRSDRRSSHFLILIWGGRRMDHS
jgi:hypothetical protein